MNRGDILAWNMIRFMALMQGYIGNLMWPYAKTMQQKMKIIQITMSGYYIWGTPMEDIPKEVLIKLIPMGKILLIVTAFNAATFVTKLVNIFRGATG